MTESGGGPRERPSRVHRPKKNASQTPSVGGFHPEVNLSLVEGGAENSMLAIPRDVFNRSGHTYPAANPPTCRIFFVSRNC